MSGNELKRRYQHLIVFCKQTKWVRREVETIDVSITNLNKAPGNRIGCKYRSLIKEDCNILRSAFFVCWFVFKGAPLIPANRDLKHQETVSHHPWLFLKSGWLEPFFKIPTWNLTDISSSHTLWIEQERGFGDFCLVVSIVVNIHTWNRYCLNHYGK